MQVERILVQLDGPNSVSAVVRRLSEHKIAAIDTETTGLNWAKDDQAFCLQIATRTFSAYFNFGRFDQYSETVPVLDRREVFAALSEWLGDPLRVLIGANIGFDVHICEREGIRIKNKLEDVLTRAQVLYNQYRTYNLHDCLKRIGREKGDGPKTWIEENDAYKISADPWSGEKIKDPDFTQVPWETITDYGFQDVEETLALYDWQEAQLNELYPKLPKDLEPRTVAIESGVANVIINMEREGIRVDREYAKIGMDFELSRCAEITREFRSLAGIDFVDSAEAIGGALESSGVTLGKTPDGNVSLASWVLEKYPKNPLVRLVLEHRDRLKRGNTYFANILRYADKDGFVHASFRSRGAYATGRMAGARPNFQNVTKGETCEYPVRKAVYPRPGRALVEIDYKAQEFRLLLEYAQEHEVAEQIRNGMDPHQVLADSLNQPRGRAKTLQFGLLYGMGAQKLADSLGLVGEEGLQEARLLKARYFKRYPGIKQFTYAASDAAKKNGFVHSWDGCRFFFPDTQWAYKAANAIIQGGCAAITKQGMINVQAYVDSCGLKTLILAQVHDAIILDMPYAEFQHVEPIQRCLENGYAHRLVPMGTTVEHSFESWYDLKKGSPYGQAGRSDIPGTMHGPAAGTPEQLVGAS